MKKRLTFTAVVACASWLVGALLAQVPAGPSKPSSEHEKLALFAGKWAAEADFKPSESSSGGKSKWTETCEWFEGNFALNCHSDGEFGGHSVKEISVMAYDKAAKTYVYFETNNSDESDLWRGKVDGDIWIWTEKGIAQGKSTQTRFTQRVSADTITFRLEEAVGDGPFKLVMEGKQARQN
jgi:hypothetical protein